MFKNKKGQGLSMNVVVIAILAVLILVIIAIIFTGGIGNVYKRMGKILQIGTEGSSLEFIKGQCNIACLNAQIMEDPSGSAYCKNTFTYDENDDGKTSDEEKAFHCRDNPINFPCDGVENECL